MKKIGILTFHYINNYGAMLQAYALKKALDRFDDVETEIINYIPPNSVLYPYESGESGKALLEGKMKKMYRFMWTQCEVKKEVVKQLIDGAYDYYCVGSDQVWNFNISSNDYTYLLKDIKNGLKISYASSVGLAPNRLGPYKESFKKYLSDFKSVSVRESEHKIWLEEECGIRCSCVLDPTFLIPSTQYDSIVTNEELVDHPFVLFLWYLHDDRLIEGIEFTNTISRKYGLPIVHNIVKAKDYMIAHSEKNMFYEGVEDFLWYIKNAAIIVTNSYHATLFAIHFKKPFYSFIVEHMKSRFDEIGGKLSVQDRFVNGYMPPEKIRDTMKYDSIYEKIDCLRKESDDYLRSSIDET